MGYRTAFFVIFMFLLFAAQTTFGGKEKPNGEAYFSPKGGAEKAIIAEIRAAKTSIKACIYLFTSQYIADALVAKAKTCEVTVIADSKRAELDGSQCEFLAKSGVKVVLFAPYDPRPDDGADACMHHKFAVIDGETLITGSYNWSVYAETTNNEDIVILKDAELAKKYSDRFKELLEEAGKRKK